MFSTQQVFSRNPGFIIEELQKTLQRKHVVLNILTYVVRANLKALASVDIANFTFAYFNVYSFKRK